MGRRTDAATAQVGSPVLRAHAQCQRHLARELPRRNRERVRAERAVASALHGVPDITPFAESFHEDRMRVEKPLPYNSYLKLEEREGAVCQSCLSAHSVHTNL